MQALDTAFQGGPFDSQAQGSDGTVEEFLVRERDPFEIAFRRASTGGSALTTGGSTPITPNSATVRTSAVMPRITNRFIASPLIISGSSQIKVSASNNASCPISAEHNTTYLRCQKARFRYFPDGIDSLQSLRNLNRPLESASMLLLQRQLLSHRR